MPKTSGLTIALLASLALSAQTPTQRVVVYEGARLIDGRGGAAIDRSAFVVENGRITTVGAQGAVQAPTGAARVNLAGKTVMPAMINVHVHIGYEGFTSWGAEN